jgi:hypothetical protein
MVGSTQNIPKKKWSRNYYQCTLQKRSHNEECTAQLIPQDIIETVIIEEMINIVKKYTAPQDYLTDEKLLQEITNLKRKLDDKKSRLKKIEREMDNLLNAIKSAGHSTALLKSLDASEKEHKDTTVEIDDIRAEISKAKISLSESDLTDIRNLLGPAFDQFPPETKKMVLTGIIDHIEAERIGNNLTGVIWHFKPDNASQGSLSHRRGTLYRHNFYASKPARKSNPAAISPAVSSLPGVIRNE